MTKNRNQKNNNNWSNSTKKKTDIIAKSGPPPQLNAYFVSSTVEIVDGKVNGTTNLSDMKKGGNFTINKNGDFGMVWKI